MRILAFLLVAAMASGQPSVAARVSGKVVSPMLDGLQAILEIEGRQVETQADGTFDAGGFSPGPHEVTVHSPGWKSGHFEIDLREGENSLPPMPLTVASMCGIGESRLSWIGSVERGAVRGSIGVAPGVIDLTLESWIAGEPASRTATIDRRGEFRFQDLAPGNYRLIARGRGFYEEIWSIRIWGGLEAHYDSPFPVKVCPDEDCRIPQKDVPRICE